ncbi:Uncharacterised protein [uncultured archaeon]|nr:Uncharacterised protein [uncultured archaeon]
MVRFLKRHPELMSKLNKCEAAVGEYLIYSIEIMPIERGATFESRGLRKKYNLLTNDSLNLFDAMKANKL